MSHKAFVFPFLHSSSSNSCLSISYLNYIIRAYSLIEQVKAHAHAQRNYSPV